MVSSTEKVQWKKQILYKVKQENSERTVELNTKNVAQTIEGFGTCFNEMGYLSINKLSKDKQEKIYKDLFAKGVGMNFTLGRMPLGANDFSADWYSYNETDGDFEMKNFSINHDKTTLIPFIKNAQRYYPKLKMWASPWSPPSWMKFNKHYAMKAQIKGVTNGESEEWGIYFKGIDNGLTQNLEGKEGTDSFIQEDKYLEAYAQYFGKFIDEYAKQKIKISMVMPQNEFNSAQPFPSCTWTVAGLNKFMTKLIPVLNARKTELFFGTMERKNSMMIDSVLNDPIVGPAINGIGFQWDGKYALPAVHAKYPKIKIYQSEQECGNGKNDWKYGEHTWDLMKHYIGNGAQAYMYWNTSLPKNYLSRWGWKQNSLISVDETTKTFKYNYDYYFLKHLSHFVWPGSKLISQNIEENNALAFLRPDGKVVYVVYNQEEKTKVISIKAKGKVQLVILEPKSMNTVLF